MKVPPVCCTSASPFVVLKYPANDTVFYPPPKRAQHVDSAISWSLISPPAVVRCAVFGERIEQDVRCQ